VKGYGGVEVKKMANKANSRGKRAPGVNPQGFGQDESSAQNPKSELENRAKKSNTKI
jgi:small acid-soluble spore protein L (minor)